MTIQEFASEHRLRVTKDACDDHVILGKVGHFYQYNDGLLGLMVLSQSKKARPNKWAKIKTACMEAGMTLRQNADDEGAFSFDPTDPNQVKVAIRVVKPRGKRQLSPERREAAIAALARAREVKTSSMMSQISV